jgi:hypothetical protein
LCPIKRASESPAFHLQVEDPISAAFFFSGTLNEEFGNKLIQCVKYNFQKHITVMYV